MLRTTVTLLTTLALVQGSAVTASATTTPPPPPRPVVTVDTPQRVEIDAPNMRHVVDVEVDGPVSRVSAHLFTVNGATVGIGQGQDHASALVEGSTSSYRLSIPHDAWDYPYLGSYRWHVTTQRSSTETTPYVRTGDDVAVVVRWASRQSLGVVRVGSVVRLTGETRAFGPLPTRSYDFAPWTAQRVSVQRLDAATGAWVEVARPAGDARARFTVKTVAPVGTQFRAVVSRTVAVWGSTSPTITS